MRANCQRWSWARARRRHWVRLGGGEGWCESERVGEVGESRSKLGSKLIGWYTLVGLTLVELWWGGGVGGYEYIELRR